MPERPTTLGGLRPNEEKSKMLQDDNKPQTVKEKKAERAARTKRREAKRFRQNTPKPEAKPKPKLRR